MKIYHVTLTDEERQELEDMTRKGTRNAQVIRNALVLLNCDENNPSRLKKDSDIASILGITERTIENIRKKFVLDGIDIALTGKPSERVYMSKVDVMDKAGAYAVQEYGDMIIKEVSGDYDNVVGLPVKKLIDELNRMKSREMI